MTEDQQARIGEKFVNILRGRVRICDEMAQQKMPLACYTREAMRRLFEVENLLDELVAETVVDIMNERSGV